jgi:PAS domain S-box-containing protein
MAMTDRYQQKTTYQSIFEAARDAIVLYDGETGRVVDANPAAGVMHGCPIEDFVGQHPPAFIHPDSQAKFTKNLETARSGGTYDDVSVHLRTDGAPVHVEVRGVACAVGDRTGVLEIGRDISGRVLADQQFRNLTAERANEQTALAQISVTLASALELHPDVILDQLRTIIHYTHAAIFALEEGGLVSRALRGLAPPDPGGDLHVPLDDPETLAVLFDGDGPVRIADVHGTDPSAVLFRSLLNDREDDLFQEIRSWMWVPLAVKGRIIGGLGIGHTRPDYFTGYHAELVLTVASQAAIAMVNSELYEHAQTLAALEERQRLAQSLHDAVNQSLFSAALIAEVLPRLWDRDPQEARQSLEDLRRLTSGAMAEMRTMLLELRPSALTDADLVDLLHLLSSALTGRTNIPVTLTITGQGSLKGQGRLPAEVQIALYRICQETLNNIAKHSWATQVEIDISYDQDAIQLRLCDNGRGFDPDRIASGHYGLEMIRERAEAVDADLEIASLPGEGTEISFRWPESHRSQTL